MLAQKSAELAHQRVDGMPEQMFVIPADEGRTIKSLLAEPTEYQSLP